MHTRARTHTRNTYVHTHMFICYAVVLPPVARVKHHTLRLAHLFITHTHTHTHTHTQQMHKRKLRSALKQPLVARVKHHTLRLAHLTAQYTIA